jgi:hypothetical protein
MNRITSLFGIQYPKGLLFDIEYTKEDFLDEINFRYNKLNK